MKIRVLRTPEDRARGVLPYQKLSVPNNTLWFFPDIESGQLITGAGLIEDIKIVVLDENFQVVSHHRLDPGGEIRLPATVMRRHLVAFSRGTYTMGSYGLLRDFL